MASEATKIPFVEAAAPSTPAASRVVIYAKSDGLMYSKDDAGAETLMSGTSASPQFTTIELGHASDTTLARVSAGVVSIEGTNIVKAGAATGSGLTMATARLLGRTTASTGAIEEITVGSGLSLAAGSLTATGGGGVSVAVLQDQKSSGTAGGAATTGSFQTHTLNTEVSDPDSIVSIASNALTPVSGDYILHAEAPCHATNRFQLRLRNTTAGTTTATGMSQFAPAASTNALATVDAVFTANGTDAYEIQYRAESTSDGNDLGVATSFGTEVYLSVVLSKI